MTLLEVHALGYERTLQLPAESKAERVRAHLDHISKNTRRQTGLGGVGGRRGPQLRASSYSLENSSLPHLIGSGNRAMCPFGHLWQTGLL